MLQIICCIKKDFLEIIRNKKTLLFNSLIIAATILVLGTTLVFPSLVDLLINKVPEMVADGSQIYRVMGKLFPQTTKENIGIWTSDVVILFTIATSLMCCNLLPNEIRDGKWVLVTEAGYSKQTILLSKMLVYGICAAAPTFVGYNIYYVISRNLITDNYSLMCAFENSIVLTLSIFFITTISITLSVVYKNYIMAVVTVIVTILAAPDILAMFSFGRLFPTYLLTSIYNSSNNFTELSIPFIALILLQIILYRIAEKRIVKIEISR